MRPRRPVSILLPFLLVGMMLLGSGCDREQGEAPRILMATTTSTANSGLLDHILPEFEKDTGIHVDFIATGTGKAIRHGRDGDVDVILVHAPPAEEEFVASGYGVERVPIMWNDFVILGPAGDPAGVGPAASAAAALKALATTQSSFVSRGDDSGTHKKEKDLWKAAGLEPDGAWYIAAGQGMGDCLMMASEKQAYILSDRGSYLAMAAKLDLAVAFAGDPELVNPYAIIAVNPEAYPEVKIREVQRLIRWMQSQRARDLIAGFRIGGQQLFHLFDE